MAFLGSFRGTHLRQPKVSFSRGSEITPSASKPLNIHADGHMVGPQSATIGIVPAAVKPLQPEDPPAFE
nr:hypothetical protein [Paeniglutamicibacter psychrophenolicus]